MPENPFLLVMVADAAAKQGDFDLAGKARVTPRFSRGGGSAVAPVTPTMAAGRDGCGPLRFSFGSRRRGARAVQEAEQSLLASLTLNPDDVEALYTIGVVRMAVGADEGAARAFSQVAETHGPLAAAARDSLRALYARNTTAAAMTFDAWQARLKWNPPEPAVPVIRPATRALRGIAGLSRVSRAAYTIWQSTGMARMFRDYRPADVIGDFSGTQIVSDHARAVSDGARHFIEIRRGDNNTWIRYPVDYVIGSKWQQAYATRLPDSRLLVFPIQYSRLRSAWVNYWKIVDAPDSPWMDIAEFHEVP